MDFERLNIGSVLLRQLKLNMGILMSRLILVLGHALLNGLLQLTVYLKRKEPR